MTSPWECAGDHQGPLVKPGRSGGSKSVTGSLGWGAGVDLMNYHDFLPTLSSLTPWNRREASNGSNTSRSLAFHPPAWWGGSTSIAP